jgi:opacity protein-like surface antigen
LRKREGNMKLLKCSVISLVLFFSFYNSGSSQIRLVIGPAIGLTSPTVDYSGETTDFYTGTKYGMRSGLNYGAVAKVTLGPLNGKVTISYASLSNSGKGDINQGPSTLEVKNNIFMVTLGTEFGFAIPLSPIRPYAGIDLLFTSISGSYTFHGTTGVNSVENSIQSASRTGLGLNVGGELSFSKSLSLDLSLHYNLVNLFGKDFKSAGTTRLDSYINLNDAKDPNYIAGDDKHFIGNDRTIATIQIQLGLLFGF